MAKTKFWEERKSGSGRAAKTKLEIEALCPIGTKFAYLTTISLPYRQTNHPKPRYFVRCVCKCGAEKDFRLHELERSKTNSCGCYRKQRAIEISQTHGLKNHLLYGVWIKMKSRCQNKSDKAFKWYGERGISVCDEWRNDFMAFYNWAMASGWQQGLTIDRRENDGNYEPNNCRIATWEVQGRNKRNTKLTFQKALTIRNLNRIGAFTPIELAGIYNLSDSSIYLVLNNRTWQR